MEQGWKILANKNSSTNQNITLCFESREVKTYYLWQNITYGTQIKKLLLKPHLESADIKKWMPWTKKTKRWRNIDLPTGIEGLSIQ